MKRICSLLLTLALVLGLCACGQKAPTWEEQYDLGMKYRSEGNYQEAIIAFTAAIEIDPKRPDAYLKAAEAYVASGDSESAIAILTRGVDATGDAGLSDYLEKLQAGPLTVLTGQKAYEPDGTLCFSIRYVYNEDGYLLRSQREDCDIAETWEQDESSGKWIHTRIDGTTEEVEGMERGIRQTYSSVGHICTSPRTQEYVSDRLAVVGEDGILENWNDSPDPNVAPRFAYAEYTFDEAGYSTYIVTYGEDGSVIGTATCEWETILPQP